MRTYLVSSALAVAVALGSAGCGASSAKTSTSSSTSPPGTQMARAIRARLVKAGYAVIRETPRPGETPHGQVAAFSIQVDFTSPASFHLYIAVFASRADLSAYLRKAAAADRAGLARCRKTLACRKSLQGRSHDSTFGVQRTVGSVFYSASADEPTGTVPPARLASVIALASGTR